MGILNSRAVLPAAALMIVTAATACSDTLDPALKTGADLARLQFIVDSTVQDAGVPGAVVGVVTTDGTRYVIASGVSDITTHSPMNASSRFRVGSITKSMVATVALQLADEGRLRLTDTISKWLPGVVANADVITIRQLLHHTSGIPDYLDDPILENAVFANPSRNFSFNELIAAANRHAPLFSPGGRWGYSNSNYLILGVIIEMITGSTLEAQLKSRIFEPLNMSSSLYPSSLLIPAPFAKGYIERDGTDLDVSTLLSPSLAAGAGAVISNASDLMIFADALARGTLVSAALHAQQISPVVASGGDGYGLGIQTFGYWVGHSGETAGYEASMYSRPGVGTIVVLVNKSPTTASIAYRIFDNVRWAEFGTR